jgi:hypothetical protein
MSPLGPEWRHPILLSFQEGIRICVCAVPAKTSFINNLLTFSDMCIKHNIQISTCGYLSRIHADKFSGSLTQGVWSHPFSEYIYTWAVKSIYVGYSHDESIAL